MWGRVILGRTSTRLGLMCFEQGHNAVTLVKLEPVAPPSRVKLSTTEPLRSPDSAVYNAKDSPCQMPEEAYKVSKPVPGPKVITYFSAQIN